MDASSGELKLMKKFPSGNLQFNLTLTASDTLHITLVRKKAVLLQIMGALMFT